MQPNLSLACGGPPDLGGEEVLLLDLAAARRVVQPDRVHEVAEVLRREVLERADPALLGDADLRERLHDGHEGQR